MLNETLIRFTPPPGFVGELSKYFALVLNKFNLSKWGKLGENIYSNKVKHLTEAIQELEQK